jgi:hypothetical protein
MRRAIALQLSACALAALVPLATFATRASRAQTASAPAAAAETAVAWPASFEGRALTPLPLGERDQRFARDFPGQVGRFHDGQRELILRHVARPTRRLHPASDCLRAVGFAIEPLPARRGPDGTAWGCFAARRGAGAAEHLTVCEQIRDAAGHTWPDASSWYWPALAGGTAGPWWSTTMVEARSR